MALMLPLFWAMSFIGATQDIASDGVYVTSLDTRAQSLYCGVQSLSWNIGPIVASGFLVYLSGRLHTSTCSTTTPRCSAPSGSTPGA
jgi:PAT family beta-lactamase induction signal transducer AmpG